MYTCTGARRPGKFYMGGTGAQSVGRVVKKFSEVPCYGGLGAGFPVAPCSRWIRKMTRMYRTQPRADGERRSSRGREVPNGERACYLVAVPWFCDSRDSDRVSFPQLIDTGAAFSEVEYAGKKSHAYPAGVWRQRRRKSQVFCAIFVWESQMKNLSEYHTLGDGYPRPIPLRIL